MNPFPARQKHSAQIRRIAFINVACHLRVYGSIGIGNDAEYIDPDGLTALGLRGNGKIDCSVSKGIDDIDETVKQSQKGPPL